MRKWLYPSILFFLLLTVVFMVQALAQEDDFSDEPYDPTQHVNTTLLDSNLFTQPDDKRPYEQGDVNMMDYTPVLENEQLILYVHRETFAIRVLNKETGFIWTTDPFLHQYDDFNLVWLNRMQSPFYFTFLNDKGVSITRSLVDEPLMFRRLEYTVDETQQQVRFTVDLRETKIRLQYSIALRDNQIQFHFTTSNVEEYGHNRLLSITFFPFLGAVKRDEIPGYLFIPSGSGALVRYTHHANIRFPYRVRFYAQDQYYSANTLDLTLNYPVYGFVHGIDQNALFLNIHSGAEYAEFTYLPPDYRTEYHMYYVTYYLREQYMKVIPGSDKSLPVIEDQIKDYDIDVNLTVLSNEEANYVGMANEYKDFLIKHGYLKAYPFNDQIELHLDVFGSDYEQGLFFKKHYEMTTTDQLLKINEILQNRGITDIFYTLRGFNRGGYVEASYRNYRFNKKLGDPEDLKNLNVRYYYNPTTMHSSKSRPPRGTMKRINGQIAYEPIRNGEYYRFYVDIDQIIKEYPKAKKTIADYGGMALDGLSYLFYSNENHKRHEMYEIYHQLIGEPIPMYRPNFVMLPYTNKYLMMPLQHERLQFITDSVPFLPIVLSGYVPYYSSFINFSANMQMDVLRLIDYGANPAFLITYEPSHLLSKTFSNEFYASYFGNLEDFIVENYHYVNEALQFVRGEAIIGREVVQEGVVVVSYRNGVEIIINYTTQDVTYKGITVKALDYAVRK